MKTHQLFWGILFLTLGSLILLNNVTSFELDWYFIWNLWPLVLVILGIYFFIKGSSYKWILVIVISFVLGFMIFAAYKSVIGFFYHSGYDSEYEAELYEVPYSDSLKKAFISIDAAAGKITLIDTTDQLVSISQKGSFGDYIFQNDVNDEEANISLEMEDQHFRFSRGFARNQINMELNTKPAWNMEFNAGAAAISLDLTPYLIDRVLFKTGATSINVKVGDKSDYTRLGVETGVSKVRIKIPKTSGCEINSHTDFVSKDYNGFAKIDNETYRTPGFEEAAKKVMIDLQADVSSIIVDRY